MKLAADVVDERRFPNPRLSRDFDSITGFELGILNRS